jgi:hypothetical protein
MVIKQVAPKIANGYQLTMQSVFLGQTMVLYTFLYNIDQNSLSFYDQRIRDWIPVEVVGDNTVNLINCLNYSRFNEPNSNSQGVPDLSVDNSVPLDTASVSVNTAPPALPDYEQPECPVDGYLWQPGYWAYSQNDNDYYWVPGVWVAPPSTGVLWTPAYWGYEGSVYIFHTGYWGNSVGFYGGINYGYGYAGVGYVGGEWHNGGFRYNTAVVRVNTTVVHNVYVNNTVINRTTINNHASFNGRGGVMARPTAREQEAMHENHIRPTTEQMRNQRAARVDKSQFSSSNHGQPASVAREKAPASIRSNTQPARNQMGGNRNMDAKQGESNNQRVGGGAQATSNNLKASGTPEASHNGPQLSKQQQSQKTKTSLFKSLKTTRTTKDKSKKE